LAQWLSPAPPVASGGSSGRRSSPGRDSLIRLVGAVLAEQHDKWTEGRRYLGLDVLARSRITLAPSTTAMNPENDLQVLSA
jgi:putative transposase